MSNQTDSNVPSASSPLLPRNNEEQENKKEDVISLRQQATPVIIAAVVNGSPTKSASEQPVNSPSAEQAPISNEYRFVHQRIPPKEGKLRFLLPALLLGFQVVFIVLFAVFGNYSSSVQNEPLNPKYPSKKITLKIYLNNFNKINIIYFSV